MSNNKPLVLKQPSWFRRWFERWLSRKFMVRFGPAMIQRRGYWLYVDPYGSIWRVEPTHDPQTPLIISCQERQ